MLVCPRLQHDQEAFAGANGNDRCCGNGGDGGGRGGGGSMLRWCRRLSDERGILPGDYADAQQGWQRAWEEQLKEQSH